MAQFVLRSFRGALLEDAGRIVDFTITCRRTGKNPDFYVPASQISAGSEITHAPPRAQANQLDRDCRYGQCEKNIVGLLPGVSSSISWF